MTEFKKDDKAKLRYDLIPPEVSKGLTEVIMFGAAKYGEHNWKTCEDPTRFIGALLRHLEAHRSGELYDDESGLLHMKHVLCNAAFLTYLSTVEESASDTQPEYSRKDWHGIRLPQISGHAKRVLDGALEKIEHERLKHKAETEPVLTSEFVAKLHQLAQIKTLVSECMDTTGLDVDKDLVEILTPALRALFNKQTMVDTDEED